MVELYPLTKAEMFYQKLIISKNVLQIQDSKLNKRASLHYTKTTLKLN